MDLFAVRRSIVNAVAGYHSVQSITVPILRVKIPNAQCTQCTVCRPLLFQSCGHILKSSVLWCLICGSVGCVLYWGVVSVCEVKDVTVSNMVYVCFEHKTE